MPTPRARPASRIAAMLVLALTGLLTAGAQPASADSVGNASSSVSSAQNQLNQDKNKYGQLGDVINKLSGEIASLRTRITEIEAAIDGLDWQVSQQKAIVVAAQATLDQLTQDLAAKTQQLAQTRARLQVDEQGLSDQIVHIYELGPTSTVNAIFGSDTFDEMWQKVIAAKRVSDAEQGAVNAVGSEKALMEQELAQIAADRQQQALNVARKQAAEAQSEQDLALKGALDQQLQAAKAADEQQQAQADADRQKVQQDINSDAAAVSAAKDALAKAEAAAAAAAAAHGGNAGSFRGGGNGKFIWPMNGGITQYYGCTSWPYERYVPSCPYPHEFHDGLDIANAWGTPIVAADTGIAYLHYDYGGYGLHVVIVHGNGWETLYGHMSSFAVHSGQVVGRGQLIGYEGSTGNSSGPHVHFEIDVNGSSVNPLNYLP